MFASPPILDSIDNVDNVDLTTPTPKKLKNLTPSQIERLPERDKMELALRQSIKSNATTPAPAADGDAAADDDEDLRRAIAESLKDVPPEIPEVSSHACLNPKSYFFLVWLNFGHLSQQSPKQRFFSLDNIISASFVTRDESVTLPSCQPTFVSCCNSSKPSLLMDRLRVFCCSDLNIFHG